MSERTSFVIGASLISLLFIVFVWLSVSTMRELDAKEKQCASQGMSVKPSRAGFICVGVQS